MGYSRTDIRLKCEEALRDVKVFYQADVVNYRGRTTDTDEPYGEVVAEFVCEHLESFQNGIPCITRKKSYRTSSHDGAYDADSNRQEELIAMQMFRHCRNGGRYDFIGKILDYQTPLKSSRSDVAGKIDLLSYDGSKLRILELKKPDSTETMLRCVLEGHTYLKTADPQKLLQDFSLPEDTEIVACPFAFRGGLQYQEVLENRPHLKKLMRLLNSKSYYISGGDGKFEVTEE